MKAIVCEMCSSHEFTKEDGLYVCQHCGTKYSIEEAKKLMVEIDNSKKLANLYERARKSLEVDDLEHAAEYYKEILDENPNDWEAYFYSYLGETVSYTNAQAAGVAAKLGKTIPAAYDMAVENSEGDEIAERVKTISQKTGLRIVGIASTAISLLREHESGNILIPSGKVQADMYARLRPMAQDTVINCIDALEPLLEKVEALYSDGKIDENVHKECVLSLLHTQHSIANTTFESSLGCYERLITNEYIQGRVEKIKKYEPDFEAPVSEADKKSGGCYVATAVYGSYDCPQVWTLRRFRDNTLAETWYGRAFIHTYYAISPTLVKWFGNADWFKNMWKPTLDRMVENLNKNGVESTPYNDRIW